MKNINDVAKAANVSPATVSKVFNGYKSVSEKTKERIFKIAEELDYFPNRSAVQLVSKNEDTIGVILSALGDIYSRDEYLLGIIGGIYSKVESFGYRVAMFTSKSILNNNQNYIQFCRSNNLIGTIVHGLEKDDPELTRLVESEIPCVFIDINVEGKNTAVISVDNENACKEVVDKLVGLGHREIVFVAGSQSASVTHSRTKGYLRGMEENHIHSPQIIDGKFVKESAYEKVKEFMINNPSTTAFFCASDLMAVGALNACLDLGYQVPEDVSIVGFDNVSFSEHVRPRLSTVEQGFNEMGSRATELLLDIYEGKDVEKHCYLPHKIIIRESVARNRRQNLDNS